MERPPTFFLSHARQDRNISKYLDQFFNDLEKRLAQLAGHILDDKKLGMIDRRINQGENWDEKLSNFKCQLCDLCMC